MCLKSPGMSIPPTSCLTLPITTSSTRERSDLNFGSFSFGASGVLKSVDGGQTWELKGASEFTPFYPGSANSFPQYQAVGKVAVDPNHPNVVMAGTKTSLYFSYDAGENWAGPCFTNQYALAGNSRNRRRTTPGRHRIDPGGQRRCGRHACM